jgi:hypothetical protein
MEPPNENASSLKIAYVVIENRGEEGYVGGYLCADERGVPIEFWHTTESPVKVTHLQTLLYGKTLKPELLGKHITGSLLGIEQGKPRLKPSVLFTEEEAILYGLDIPAIVIVLIKSADSHPAVNSETTCRRIATGSGEVVIHWRKENTAEVEHLIPLLTSVDVLEPFKRIRVLLEEFRGTKS